MKNSILNALNTTKNYFKQRSNTFTTILKKNKKLGYTISGPVRASLVIGQIADVGTSIALFTSIRACTFMAGIISVSLSFINLIPLPALDGSEIIISLCEIIKGLFTEQTLLKPRTYKIINTTSHIFLLLLIIWISDTLTTCSAN